MLKRINQNPPYGTNYPLNGGFGFLECYLSEATFRK